MQLTKPKKKAHLLAKNQIFIPGSRSSWRALPTYPFDDLDFRSLEDFGSLGKSRSASAAGGISRPCI